MTCLEKLKKEFPDDWEKCLILDCPEDYDYLDMPEWCDPECKCEECWNREIPETKTTEKEINNMADYISANTYLKKTKAQLIEELDSAKKELEKFEKYRKYDEMGEELYAAMSSLVNAGFSRDEAFKLLLAAAGMNH